MGSSIRHVTIREFMAGSASSRILRTEIDRVFQGIRGRSAALFSPQNRGWSIKEAHRVITTHRVALSSDHAGLHARAFVERVLRELGVSGTRNFGPSSHFPGTLNFPIWVVPALEALNDGTCTRAILCCGSGTGVAIAANKMYSHRSVKAVHPKDVVRGREHNNVDVLTVGELMIADREVRVKEVLESIVLFLSTPFIEEPARYAERNRQLEFIHLLSARASVAGIFSITDLPEFPAAVRECPELADMLVVKAHEAIQRGDMRVGIGYMQRYKELGRASKNYERFLAALEQVLEAHQK